MSNSSHVLIYGKDLTLLETRGWILAKAGFLVECALTVDEVEGKMGEHRPDVLVLCHTLSAEDCGRVQQIVQQGRLLMKTLVLSTRTSGCTTESATATLTVPPDPLQLITMVEQLARRNGHNTETFRTE